MLTKEQEFIYNQVIEANKIFKWERLARVLTEIFFESFNLEFKELQNDQKRI